MTAPTSFIHPAPVGCRRCGTILQASYAAEAEFCCPTCGEPACYTCGCTETRACSASIPNLAGSRTATMHCGWVAPGLCSFCGGRAAYEMYMAATGRPAVDRFYLGLAPSAFAVRGLGAGLDQLHRLEARSGIDGA